MSLRCNGRPRGCSLKGSCCRGSCVDCHLGFAPVVRSTLVGIGRLHGHLESWWEKGGDCSALCSHTLLTQLVDKKDAVRPYLPIGQLSRWLDARILCGPTRTLILAMHRHTPLTHLCRAGAAVRWLRWEEPHATRSPGETGLL